MKKKTILLWGLALIITLSAAVYQRLTGPTHPKREKLMLSGQEIKLKLTRSSNSDQPASIQLPGEGIEEGLLHFRPYPTKGDWQVQSFQLIEGKWTASLAPLPAAGKYEYYLELRSSGETIFVNQEKPVRIRFKDPVPDWVLVPHVLAMFIAMLLANLAGLMAAFRMPQFRIYTHLTLAFLTIGGMILGPIVQKYAFGDYWTGVPFGWDLTDNKLLLAFLFFLGASLGNLKREKPWITITAAILLLLVYSIPHSMFGSELDPETGKIIQGAIMGIGI